MAPRDGITSSEMRYRQNGPQLAWRLFLPRPYTFLLTPAIITMTDTILMIRMLAEPAGNLQWQW